MKKIERNICSTCSTPGWCVETDLSWGNSEKILGLRFSCANEDGSPILVTGLYMPFLYKTMAVLKPLTTRLADLTDLTTLLLIIY